MYDYSANNSPKQRAKEIVSKPKMRKILMKNRRLLHSCVAVSVVLLVSVLTKTNAVPTDSTGVHQHSPRPLLLHRALRDIATIVSASLVQESHKDAGTSTDTIPEQPQGQCLMDGVLIAETSVECETQVGCRAIQKTGHCCPDYKCDCEKDGKTYLNGNKLVDPETPCTVCYCKGGEILCSSAVCFHRDDCTPRYIAGRCCPEYDNCPVANKTMIASTSTAKPEVPPASILNPSITIKEITKPTEIRITDENKAKPIHQMLKTSTSTSTTTSTTVAPSTTSESTSVSATDAPSTVKTLTLFKVADDAKHIEEPIKTANSGNLDAVIVPTDLTENRAESPISQELHRAVNEPGNGSSKINIKREYMFGSTEGPLNGSFIEAVSDLSSAELFSGGVEPGSGDFNNSLLQAYADIDTETAGSDNIYHIILSTDGPRDVNGTNAEGLIVTKLPSSTEGIYPDVSTQGIESNSSERITTDEPLRVSDSTTETPENCKSISTTHHHVEDDDAVLPMDSNPAYPSLPEDDFSIRDINLPLTEVDDTAEADIKDEQRNIKTGNDTHKISTQIIDDPIIDDGSGSALDLSNDTDADMYSSTTTSTMDLAFEKVELTYSSEEVSSEETAISNATDFKIKKFMQEKLDNETGSGDSSEISSVETISDIGSGNGSEDLLPMVRSKKEREPTTPRPTRQPSREIDIDELGAESGNGNSELADDPKLDAESLKIDEKDNDSIVQKEPGTPKNGILNVKVDPTQDKTFVELHLDRSAVEA